MRKFVVGLLGFLLLSQIGTAKAGKDSSQPNPNEEMPFELVSGYLMVVEGSIGPLHGLKFVLDTGATHTAVNGKVAEQLGLPLLTGKVFNIDKMVETGWTALPEVEFGPIRASHLPAMVTDLDYFRSLGSHVDAVIGLDLLRQRNFSIDFARKKIRFGQLETGRHAIPMMSDDLSLKVEAEANGRLIHMILDSGAPGPMLYEERLENRAVDYSIEQEDYGFRIHGVLRLTRARLRRLQLGGSDVGRTVFLTHSPAKGVLDGVDGFLGLTALRARRINFDFENNTLSWTN
jgi:hypothetical protein